MRNCGLAPNTTKVFASSPSLYKRKRERVLFLFLLAFDEKEITKDDEKENENRITGFIVSVWVCKKQAVL